MEVSARGKRKKLHKEKIPVRGGEISTIFP
jgi:hypothetical protein